MTEEVYSNNLSDEAIRCDTMYLDRLLNFFFFEGLLTAKFAQLCNYRAMTPQKDYQAVSRYSQGILEAHRSSCRLYLRLWVPRKPTDTVN